MTSLATLLGMIPLALGLEAGSEQYAPLARAMIGGLAVSVVVTLFLVPAVYLLIHGRRGRTVREPGATPVAGPSDRPTALKDITAIGSSVRKSAPMFRVPDMRATVRWYESIGFTVDERYEDAGELMFARLSFGNGELALSPGGTAGPRDVSLWFFTDRVQQLYELLKERQLRAAQTALAGGFGNEPDVRFQEDLYEPFYGGRQFSILDLATR